jgi:hypothetical protein
MESNMNYKTITWKEAHILASEEKPFEWSVSPVFAGDRWMKYNNLQDRICPNYAYRIMEDTMRKALPFEQTDIKPHMVFHRTSSKVSTWERPLYVSFSGLWFADLLRDDGLIRPEYLRVVSKEVLYRTLADEWMYSEDGGNTWHVPRKIV